MTFTTILLLGLLASGESPAPLDGPHRTFEDDLLKELPGKWRLRGSMAGGEAVDHVVEVDWVLNHQFLRIHETAAQPSKSGMRYEAMVFLGRDNTSERYVAHWLDVFGGRWSETLGYGRRDGATLELLFEYPDGPFRTSLRWDAAHRTWRWLMRQKAPTGEWKDFLDATLSAEH